MRSMNASVCFAALLLTAAVMPALAAPQGDSDDQRRVVFSDLDLSQSADTQELYRRISRAAGDICDMYRVPLVLMSEARKCRDAAIGRAVGRVNEEPLTSYHQKMSS